ncbi:MAG: hypothetical protein QUS12_01725, partial [Methanosarcina sp.]|nr:hypothetical protein [Methanosarcina sp.]
ASDVYKRQAHETLKSLFEKYYQTKPKAFIELLYLIREQESFSNGIEALNSMLKIGLIPTPELLMNVLQQSPDPVPAYFCYDTFPLQVPAPDFRLYDQMIPGGKDG